MSKAIVQIINAFGGVRPTARALGKGASVIQYWKKKGFLPRDHRETVLAALKAKKLLVGCRESIVDKAISGLSVEVTPPSPS